MGLLELLLYIFLFLFIIFHVLTYSIRWYEEAKRRGEEHSIWEFSPRLVLPILAEMASHLAMLVLTGADFVITGLRWLLERFGSKSAARSFEPTHFSPPSATGRPVILIHGMGMRGLALLPLALRLRREGRTVHLFTYWPPGRLIDGYARQLSMFIERIRQEHGYEELDLVAHSLGGLIARRYMQMNEGTHPIRRVVTIGTPHRGSELWRFSIYASGRQLRPDGELLRSLDGAGLREGMGAVAIASTFDELVIPNDNARWERDGVINITVENLGHARMVFSREVYNHIRKSLT
ncbi:MAG: alpha/beta fold hydrolase [Candidatus Tectomicrobia bacterium]|uniref:Alpha/beta fold hydrolase n=1 Tax=Tectimicrobiota bacterium TaxID=2528274 RepID=A0A932HYW8_UNCTE|nr:alpha/beta fold hydrolase [Candidatus Tectomicrobia bacterium]